MQQIKCISTKNSEFDNYFDNEIVKSIFYKNAECSGKKPFQHVYKFDLARLFMRNNKLFSMEAGEDVIGKCRYKRRYQIDNIN